VKRQQLIIGVALLALLWPGLAQAYIGPGAGFAFMGSIFVLLATFALALSTILLWPITFVIRLVRVGNPYKNAKAKRVVILGLDGMDPGLATKYILEGRMPNFKKLAEKGVFRPLQTSHPSMSPVAWSTFATGVDPSGHSIYDFLTRDPCTYTPILSSTDIGNAEKVMNIGKYIIPLSKPRIKLLRKKDAFWKFLGERNIFSTIQRVPITFPPQPFKGLLLSGMCVPDLRGSQGTFSFFSTDTDGDAPKFTGGEQTVLRRKGNVIRSRVVGPDNSMVQGGLRMTLPFTLTVAEDKKSATIEIEGCEPFTLEAETYSPWIQLSFKPGLGITVAGIARFYLMSIDPHVNMYMTPIHIDPENPAMPISHPHVYSIYLAKKLGPFATLGLAEDTWALNERIIDEKAFIQAAYNICDEREKMFFDALGRTKKGFLTTVFDTTDRIQHMFYRYLDPTHPANEGKDQEQFVDTIPQVYEYMDGLLGRIQEKLDEDTVLMVISDHGFTNFRRGVNLNTWLLEKGYLVLKDGATTSGDWFDGVDWDKTRAFSLGLTGIFINRKGREKSGIVAEGQEYDDLVAEIKAGLEALVDPSDGRKAVRRVVRAQLFFQGPYKMDAPDLLVGYEGGFRNSWECATGSVTETVFSDNTKSWSGDHCVDPNIVPGIFFCNKAIDLEAPHLMDLPTTVMNLFGQKPPKYMQGRDIMTGAGEQTKGMLDPHSLEQSGSAPGALIFEKSREESA
jgi:predicted AlkP superfamily phosphohydrolase/phosphomutase